MLGLGLFDLFVLYHPLSVKLIRDPFEVLYFLQKFGQLSEHAKVEWAIFEIWTLIRQKSLLNKGLLVLGADVVKVAVVIGKRSGASCDHLFYQLNIGRYWGVDDFNHISLEAQIKTCCELF